MNKKITKVFIISIFMGIGLSSFSLFIHKSEVEKSNTNSCLTRTHKQGFPIQFRQSLSDEANGGLNIACYPLKYHGTISWANYAYNSLIWSAASLTSIGIIMRLRNRL